MRPVYLVILYFIAGLIFVILGQLGFFFPALIIKAILIPILAWYFYMYIRTQVLPFHRWVLAALFFSWLGDVLLELISYNEMFFILGLGSFLITQLLYSGIFFSTRGKFQFLRDKSVLVLVVLAYGLLMVYSLWGNLGEMRVPVVLYAVVITAMVMGALSRYHKVCDMSYQYVFFGAVIFFISDSLIAVNKFKMPINYANFLIMGTYLLGQYLIILGCIKQELK
jgi:uncharacterized membrane protein YhhN